MTGSLTNSPPRADAAAATAPAPPIDHEPGQAIDPLQRLPVTLQPDRNLLRYYLLSALMFGPGFVIAVFPFYFRFRTLRYDVDEEGITMRWGILFRREISLTYARIQDIQLSSNVVERWLGLARIQLQTASGSATAEMTIEGIRDVDAMRDFLYSRMRGAKGGAAVRRAEAGATVRPVEARATAAPAGGAAELQPGSLDELTATLDAVAEEVRALRLAIADRRTPGGRDA